MGGQELTHILCILHVSSQASLGRTRHRACCSLAPEVHAGTGEEVRVEAVQQAAVAGDQVGRVLRGMGWAGRGERGSEGFTRRQERCRNA